MGATDSRAPAGFAPIAIGLALTLDPPDQHSDHQHVRQSSAFNGACAVGRRHRFAAAMALLARPDCWRRAWRDRLQHDRRQASRINRQRTRGSVDGEVFAPHGDGIMRFFSDNAATVHPAVLDALSRANRADTAYDGDALSQSLDGAFWRAVRTRCQSALDHHRNRRQWACLGLLVPALWRRLVPQPRAYPVR